MIQVLSTEEYQKMPWKNGQGMTLEIARSHGRGFEDFSWRVSIADVKQAGSFSHFPNKQRVIGVLEGTVLSLKVDGQQTRTLAAKQFFTFHGEADVYAEVPQGPIRDFNLIYDPKQFSARLQWLNDTAQCSWISDAEQVLIFNNAAELKICVNAVDYALKMQESVLIQKNTQPTQLCLAQHPQNDLCVIELFAK